MPKRCQSCGALLEDNDVFCSACGAKAVRYTDFLSKPETSDNSQYSRQTEDCEPSYEDAAFLRQGYEMASYQRSVRKKNAAVLIVLLLIVALTLFVILPLANVDVFGLHLFGAGTKNAVTEATEAAAPSETVHETLFPSGLI